MGHGLYNLEILCSIRSRAPISMIAIATISSAITIMTVVRNGPEGLGILPLLLSASDFWGLSFWAQALVYSHSRKRSTISGHLTCYV